MSASQTASELQAVLADIAKILHEVDWSGNVQQRRPAVVIGVSMAKVLLAQRLASTIERDIARKEVEATERAQITNYCLHCGDTHVVSVLVGNEERFLPCRVCSSFSHTGAAA